MAPAGRDVDAAPRRDEQRVADQAEVGLMDAADELYLRAGSGEVQRAAQQTNAVLQIMPGDYAISKQVFDEAQTLFGKCVIDAFASEATALCRRFYIQETEAHELGGAEGAERVVRTNLCGGVPRRALRRRRRRSSSGKRLQPEDEDSSEVRTYE